ncbi:MAG: hypothetical protein OHK0056_26720 [Bacteriovoracaceae bacterium]
MKSLSLPQVCVLSFILAFCSLSYELIFAQILTALFGLQIEQYNLVVSLFTFFLGTGALFYPKIESRFSQKEILCSIELILFFIGGFAPFLIIFFPWKSLAVLIVALSGFFSGIELPFLMSLNRNQSSKILGADYFGMFAATIGIPFIFFQYLGIMASSVFISLINLCVLFIVIKNDSKRYTFIFSILLTMVIYFSNTINNAASNIYSGFYLE